MDDLHATELPRTLALSPHDCEVFQRVWQRVMPENLEGCPIRPRTPQEVAEATLRATPDPTLESTHSDGTVPLACQRWVEGASSIHSGPTGDVHPTPHLSPSAHIAPPAVPPHPASVVQQFIVQSLVCATRYRAMSAQTKGATSRTLSTLANDAHNQAKKLSALHFLYWGIQYWPNQLPPAPSQTYPNRLRAQFCAQRQAAVAYITAAHCCESSDLRQLYLELAQVATDHAHQLRTLAEGL